MISKEDMVTILIGAAILAAFVYLFYYKKKAPTTADADAVGGAETGKTIIYGSMGCPYTVKQREKYPDHEFVDCSNGGCPDFVSAFPTTKWADGKIDVGFN